MKRVRIIGTAALLLLFGVAGFGYAQQDQQGEKQGKPEKQSEPAQQHSQQQQQDQGKHQHAQQQQQDQGKQHAQQQQQDQGKQQHAQQQQQDQGKQQHAQQQQQDQGKQQHAQQQQQDQGKQQHVQVQRTQQQQVAQEGEQRGDWHQHRAHNWDSEHRDWRQRGGYNGYRIPDTYYTSYYGRDHSFRVYSLPFMYVGGYPRFQYGGYWFSAVDPYPEYWGDDWYETDDVYVAYLGDGYYLYNRSYPDRPGVAISITF